MPGGRPPKWTDPKVVEKIGLAYFKQCEKDKLPLTITGLALALDTTRQTLIDYEEQDEFLDTIKRLKSICENYAEQQAYMGRNPGGSIFILKNYGWKDKQEIDHKNDGGKFDPIAPDVAKKLEAVYEEAMRKKLT
jgi:hypothetical protein